MEPLPLPSSPSSGYSDVAGLATRRRCYRRGEVGDSLGGSARWSINTHKKINWKKSESHEDETREHVVLLLCKLTPLGERIFFTHVSSSPTPYPHPWLLPLQAKHVYFKFSDWKLSALLFWRDFVHGKLIVFYVNFNSYLRSDSVFRHLH